MPPRKRPPDPSDAGTAKRLMRSAQSEGADGDEKDSCREQKRQPKTAKPRESTPPPSASSSHTGPHDIVLQLSQKTLANTKLQNPQILTILNTIYITEPNGTTSDRTTYYLYDLVCRIFEC